MKVMYYWLTMGPYHFARMQALASQPGIELYVVEATDIDDHYWSRSETTLPFHHHSLIRNEVLNDSVTRRASLQLKEEVEKNRPEVLVNGAGYFDPVLYRELRRIKKKLDPWLLLWSESTAHDQKRQFWKEKIKQWVVSLYDGAIVAGQPHKTYLEELGMPQERVQVVGNVVDNSFYHAEPDQNGERSGFLYSGRFLDIKNPGGLLKAYAEYRYLCSEAHAEPEQLYLAGDGPAREQMEEQVRQEGIEGVIFTGILQPEEIKTMYARCSVFILPSTSEPWGLVVNEAMAAGMPVLVSRLCGCSSELVEDGANGYRFDPYDQGELARRMLELSRDRQKSVRFGAHSQQLIQHYTPQTYAEKCAHFFRNISRQPA